MALSPTTTENVKRLIGKISSGTYAPPEVITLLEFLDGELVGSIRELRDLKNHPEKTKGKFHTFIQRYILTKAMRNETFSVPQYFVPRRIYPHYFPEAVEAFLDLNNQQLVRRKAGLPAKKIKAALQRILVQRDDGRYVISQFASPMDIRDFFAFSKISYFSPEPFVTPGELERDLVNTLHRVGISTSSIHTDQRRKLRERLTMLFMHYATGASFKFDDAFTTQLGLKSGLEVRLATGVQIADKNLSTRVRRELLLNVHIKSHELDKNLPYGTGPDQFTSKTIFYSGLEADAYATPDFLSDRHFIVNRETGSIYVGTEIRPTLDPNFRFVA